MWQPPEASRLVVATEAALGLPPLRAPRQEPSAEPASRLPPRVAMATGPVAGRGVAPCDAAAGGAGPPAGFESPNGGAAGGGGSAAAPEVRRRRGLGLVPLVLPPGVRRAPQPRALWQRRPPPPRRRRGQPEEAAAGADRRRVRSFMVREGPPGG